MKTFVRLAVAIALSLGGLSADEKAVFQAKDYSHLKKMPGFTEDLIALHLKLYEGYVKNANLLRQKLQELVAQGKDKTPEYAGLKRMYGWEYDGMRLHELYFGNLGGSGKFPTENGLKQILERDFGSVEAWKQDFIATGLMRGIGWAVLTLDEQTGRLTNIWVNEHDLGHLVGNQPILIMDVFEHAYLPKFGLDRAAYIDAFFQNIDWNVVSKRLPQNHI